MPVAGVGDVTVQQDGVAVQQPASGAVREPGNIVRIAAAIPRAGFRR
jgi:hypothetical protein